MAGAADLVSALTGGAGIEQAAYDKAAQRILEAQKTQEDLKHRIQETYALTQQNKARDMFGPTFQSVLNAPGRQPNAPYSQEEIARLVPLMLEANNYNFTDAGSGMEKQILNMLRMGMYEGAGQAGFTPFNQAAATFQGKPIETLDKVGDLVVRDNLTDNPMVDAVLSGQNAAFGARSDKSGRGTENERKIQAIMQRINDETGKPYTRQEAEDRVWFEDINVNAVTGQPFLQNDVTQAITPLEMTGAGGDTPRPVIPEEQTFYSLSGDATGPANMARDLWARASSLVGGKPDFKSTKAIENIKINLQQIIRGLSISDRNPVTEQERLLEWINLEPGWLTSEDTFNARIDGANDALVAKLQASERDAGDYTLPPAIQKAAQQDVRTVKMALDVLGHPDWRNRNKNGADVPQQLYQQIEAEYSTHPEWQTWDTTKRDNMIRWTAKERMQK